MAKKAAKAPSTRSARSSQQTLQRMLEEALKLPGVKEAEALARNVPTIATPTLVPAAGFATGGNADAE